MLKLFLWLRYLRKKKIVFLSIAAVALSTALLIVVASLFNGFIGAVEQVGREAFGDIYLNPWVQIPEYGDLIERLESLPEVKAASAVLDTYGLLHIGRGDVRAIRILGIELPKYVEVSGLKESLLNQKDVPGEPSFAIEDYPESPCGFVSIGVLGRPDEETDRYDFEQIRSWFGKEVVLTTGAVIEKEGGTVSGEIERRFKRRTLKFGIADIVFTGMYLRDSKDVYLPIEQVRELVGGADLSRTGPHEVIQIKLAEGLKAEDMLGPVRKVWEGFAREHNLPEYAVSEPLLKTSRQMQEFFIAELKKQMAVLILIFGVVCSAAVLLIFCIFYMIVRLKQKDIAIVKSCGTTSGSVALIFVGFGVCVGIVGSGLGLILGYIVTDNINTIEGWIRVVFGLKLWKSSVYVFEKIPEQVDLGATFWIILFAIIAAGVGALIPAIVAARTKPVEILRYE